MVNKEIEDLKNTGYFVGIVEGAKCVNLRASISNIASAFRFPDYYGENLNAFWECINDLDWLSELNYALVIQNSSLFMAGDTEDNKLFLIKRLNEVSKQWANVPNFENEEVLRHKADFKVIYT